MIDFPENHQPLPVEAIKWGTPLQEIKLPYDPVKIGKDLTSRTWRLTMFGHMAYLTAWGTQKGHRLWSFTMNLHRLHRSAIWGTPEAQTAYNSAVASLTSSYGDPDQTYDFHTQPELLYKLQHLPKINDYSHAAYWYSKPLKVRVGLEPDEDTRWCYTHSKSCSFASVMMDFTLSDESRTNMYRDILMGKEQEVTP